MKKITIAAAILFSLTLSAQQKKNNIIVKMIDPSIAKVLNSKAIGVAQIDRINIENNSTGTHKLITGKNKKTAIYVFSFPAEANLNNIISQYEKTGLIVYAETDAEGTSGGVKGVTLMPTDPLYNRQWGLNNNGTFALATAITGADIQMQDAWDIEQGSSDIVVATMDSGLRLTHPEFSGRLWTNTAEIPDNGIDDDENGYVDDINGWDFVNSDNLPIDDMGHGTNVTGIIAANGNNGIGYAGIDTNCKLMTLKGLDANNSGLYSWWTEAIYYAADHGANVINLSVGGNTYSTALKEAIDYALENNVVVVACMMNYNNNTPYYPANFSGVIAVGSTNPDDSRTAPFFWSSTSGSNYGSHISVVAPGNFIYGLDYASNTNYDSYWGGTSQATPAVAGIAALLLAQDPARTPAQIKTILEATAEDQVGDPAEDTEGFDIYYGHGRVNAYNALMQTLSIKQNKIQNPVTIAPNPSHGDVIITTENYPAEITVHNLLGQLILKQDIEANSNTVSIKEKGMMLVTISNNKGSETKKIIIK